MIHTDKRVLVRVDTEQKNYTTFADGTTIRLERGYNNLDGQYTNQVRGIVISSDVIPKDAIVLFHFNSLHASNEVFDHSELTKEETTNNIKIFSIPEQECFLWREHHVSTWKTIPPFVTALKVFEPYTGKIEGVEPKQVKNILYITSGELKGKCVHTVKAADYCIIFRGDEGKDEYIVRCRHYEGEDNPREEVVAIDNHLTQRIKKGELLVGYSKTNCKILKEWAK